MCSILDLPGWPEGITLEEKKRWVKEWMEAGCPSETIKRYGTLILDEESMAASRANEGSFIDV